MSVYIPEKAKETMDVLDDEGYLIHMLFLNTASCNLYSYTSNKEDIISFLDEYIKKWSSQNSNKSLVRIIYVGKGRKITSYVHNLNEPRFEVYSRNRTEEKYFIPIDYSFCDGTVYNKSGLLNEFHESIGVRYTDTNISNYSSRYYESNNPRTLQLRFEALFDKKEIRLVYCGKIGSRTMLKTVSNNKDNKTVWVWWSEKYKMFSAQTTKPNEEYYLWSLEKTFPALDEKVFNNGFSYWRTINTVDRTLSYLKNELGLVKYP